MTHKWLAATVAAGTLAAGSAAAIPLGDVGDFVGNAGFGTPSGVVSASPVGSSFVFLTTAGGVSLDGLGEGGETNGTELTTDPFSLAAGERLEYYFNYVTSDGAGFADYAYAFLINEATSEELLFFTARTTPDGDTVPGFGLPALDAAAVLTPSSTPIITVDDTLATGPEWAPLGDGSGECFDAGCGYSDWIFASLEVPEAGDYRAVFGVVNWDDDDFDSGLALAGLTAGDVIIIPPDPGPSAIPLPGAAPLLALGLGGLLWTRRNRSAR